ncbi:acyl-CoA thioesterase [Mycolicibacterium confluentis]|uniref:Acyl-CoA thioesterase II n=1 Tax=Mycolicibacterium confluentis TaxID=28047 RepID=A0A7I7Y5H0_9MYCO|nr:acyl-CoA thioesterase domain-containing protein [Mycolicibacterium confluentis]MCV7319255.1 thioesterase family protein [Mycolicibacterium confluentis]ORV33553.1 acyl-CoA thioesterase II [Mycolicibacterium confluentis]BBZ36870.1 acyl-CoA thioesterase II [Mycolicibacterium confluentis]
MTGVNKSWIAQLLQFDRDGDTFVVTEPPAGPGSRLFGGLIAAQSLGAAGATVEPDKHPHSLHLYFVRGGSYDAEVEFVVERTRDGRSFDTRRVTATQHGKVIMEMITSFQIPESGVDHHPPAIDPVGLDGMSPQTPPIELADRFEFRWKASDSPFPVPPLWLRTRDEIEDDPLVRACTLAFMSDFGTVPGARPPGTVVTPEAGFATSLDHAVWFHRPFNPHEWHRYDLRNMNNSGSRGLVTGSFYDTSNRLVATTTQEALFRF